MEAVRITILAGTHIDAGAVALVGAANLARRPVFAEFNGVKITAQPGDSPAAIVTAYDEGAEAQAEAWRKSPEGKASAVAQAAEQARLQAEADRLVAALQGLDFTDQSAVLDFLVALQPSTDRIGVVVDRAAIAATFAAQGFAPNECTGPAFDGNDRDIVYRWLVGQALDGLTKGPAIHGIFHRFVGEWRSKWGRS